MDSRQGFSRRRALSLFIAAAAAAISGVLASIVGRFFAVGAMTRPAGASKKIPAGKLEDFAPGSEPVEATVAFDAADGYFSEVVRRRLFIVSETGGLAAISATCTHLGCAVSWDREKQLFHCPCHGGSYRKDGSVAGGPPPKPLGRLPLTIENGTVFVDVGDLA